MCDKRDWVKYSLRPVVLIVAAWLAENIATVRKYL